MKESEQSDEQNFEYIVLPRTSRTVVDWETDAMAMNTGKLYLTLCQHLVKKPNPKPPINFAKPLTG